MDRKKFVEIFKEKGDTLTLLMDVKVKEQSFKKGKSFTDKEGLAGVDFHKFRYLDIAGKETGGVFEITGFFPQE